MSGTEHARDDDSGLATQPGEPELAKPPRYTVTFINDDYTTVEFVVHVLMKVMFLTEEEASRVTATVHQSGKASVGSYSRDVAESKAALVINYSQQQGHPLQCTVEPLEE